MNGPSVMPLLAAEKVNHPKHYNSHPSGVECIDVVEHMSFNIGNAIKYLWRSDHKGAKVEDLEKARWYIVREIGRITSSLSADNARTTENASGGTSL